MKAELVKLPGCMNAGRGSAGASDGWRAIRGER